MGLGLLSGQIGTERRLALRKQALATAAKFREKSTAPGSRGRANAIRVKAVERPAEPSPDLQARLAAINAKVAAGYSPTLPKTTFLYAEEVAPFCGETIPKETDERKRSKNHEKTELVHPPQGCCRAGQRP